MKIEDVIQSTKPLGIFTKTVINLLYSSRVIEESVVATLKPYDLSMQQYNVLRILRGQQGEPANLSTVQERMVDKNSNTTRLIDKLIAKKLVKRQVCKHNRRKIELFITPFGLNLLATLDPVTEGNNMEILNRFTQSELEQLNTLLNKIRS